MVIRRARWGGAVLVRGERSLFVSLLGRKLRWASTASIGPVNPRKQAPRVSGAVLRERGLVFGLTGAGRRGIYFAGRDGAHALDVRSGVNLAALAGARVVAWDALPSDCRIPPAGLSVVRGDGSVMYALARFGDHSGNAAKLIGCTDSGPPRVVGSAVEAEEWLGTFEFFYPVALAGPYAAVDHTARGCFHGCFTGDLESIDLRTGAVVARAALDRGGITGGTREDVLTTVGNPASGAFAFVSAFTDYEADTTATSVRALGITGGDRVLDPGPDVDPQSLRFADGVVTWTNAGKPRSAPLP